MNHHTTSDFWDCYQKLPQSVSAHMPSTTASLARDDSLVAADTEGIVGI